MPVSDQGGAKRFYRYVLGFDLVRETPSGPRIKKWIQLSPKGCSTTMLVG